MRISEMKNKIDIQEKTSNGPFQESYITVVSNIWAKKEQLAGSQLVQALGESNKIPCNFIIRRNDKITNKMYVKCNDQMYDIVSAIPLGGNDTYTILTCFEIE